MRSCKSIDWSNLAKLKVSTQQAGGPSKIMGTSFHSSRVRVGETKHFVKPNPEIQKNNMKKVTHPSEVELSEHFSKRSN